MDNKPLYQYQGYEVYASRRSEILERIPVELEAADPDSTVIHGHISLGTWDWFIAVYDPATDKCFGYVRGLAEEWGSFQLGEVERLEASGILAEFDTGWEPTSFAEVRDRFGLGRDS